MESIQVRGIEWSVVDRCLPPRRCGPTKSASSVRTQQHQGREERERGWEISIIRGALIYSLKTPPPLWVNRGEGGSKSGNASPFYVQTNSSSKEAPPPPLLRSLRHDCFPQQQQQQPGDLLRCTRSTMQPWFSRNPIPVPFPLLLLCWLSAVQRSVFPCRTASKLEFFRPFKFPGNLFLVVDRLLHHLLLLPPVPLPTSFNVCFIPPSPTLLRHTYYCVQ